MKLSVGKRTQNSICFSHSRPCQSTWIRTVSFFLFIRDNWRKNPRTPKFYKKNIEKRVLKNIFQKNTFLQSYNPTILQITTFFKLTISIFIYISIIYIHFWFFSLLFLAVGICRNLQEMPKIVGNGSFFVIDLQKRVICRFVGINIALNNQIIA